MKPFIVQFGAGAIGRGFLGQLWTEGGYEVLFVEVHPEMVDRLNANHGYSLRLVENERREERIIQPVRALLNDGSIQSRQQIVAALADCAFCCSAVGVNVFNHLAPLLADGIRERFQAQDNAPLNIVCCENQKGAAALLQAEVANHLPDEAVLHTYFESSVAFVDASVGRMVPPPTPDMLAENPLLLVAEPYKELPIDGAAWCGPAPAIPGLLPKQNFEGYVARKLFIHNGGHALLSYHGYQRQHTFIWECAENPALAAELRGFWNEVGTALIRAYGFDPDELRAHEDDLLHRFRNRALGDTVLRVGRDPARKLRSEDRLVGAALLCEEQGIEPVYAARTLAAALRFNPSGDPSAAAVQDEVSRRGVEEGLQIIAGTRLPRLATLVAEAYNNPAWRGGNASAAT